MREAGSTGPRLLPFIEGLAGLQERLGLGRDLSHVVEEEPHAGADRRSHQKQEHADDDQGPR